jgi:light-regulated signal transduction histidine kinase (bacteriophytochrome)
LIKNNTLAIKELCILIISIISAINFQNHFLYAKDTDIKFITLNYEGSVRNYSTDVNESANISICREEASYIPNKIVSPIWQKEWFKIFVVLSIMIMIYIFFRIKIKQIKIHEKELQNQVVERTSELEQKTKELKCSNAELERFAYIASHDLQEPLRMVSSYVQLLSNRYKDKLDSEADEFICYAINGTNRMRKLIDDLLIYSRLKEYRIPLKTVNLELVVKTVLENLKPAIIDSNAVVSYSPMPSISANESQMIQLFQNLISNAIKFRGKNIPRIYLKAKKRDNAWQFSVSDNGIGIKKEFRERIFQVFQRLHNYEEYNGTGIGLSICKKIVEIHNGEIWIDSKYGKGSTFYFTIKTI